MSAAEAHEDASRRRDSVRWAGAGAAFLWVSWCVRFFDVAAPWRPSPLAAIPPAVLGAACLALLVWWLRGRWPVLRGEPLGRGDFAGLLLVVTLAVFARLPIAIGGAASTVTPDGTLYGIAALRALGGSERLVFMPSQPYGGTLSSLLVAPLAAFVDPARALALVSVLFYALHVAGLYRLAARLFDGRVGLLAGLYAAFAPVAVTRYSLNNDGTYVELLALGTWVLFLVARWTQEENHRALLALVSGVLLGLAFWYHILAIVHVTVVVLAFLAFGGRSAARSLAAMAAGWALGCTPALLWNAANDWQSFAYFVPGRAQGAEEGATSLVNGLWARLAAMVTSDWPVLMGYDLGYPALLDRLLLVLGWLGVAVALVSVSLALRAALRTKSKPLAVLLLFLATNVAVALLTLRHVPGNPRYLLCLMSVLPVLVAAAFGSGWRRLVLLLLIAASGLASLAQIPPTARSDARWREFVSRLEAEGVRYCYTDYHLATRITFLSRQRILCSAKLGPTTTEFFLDVRKRVEEAPEAALVTVNRTAAERIARRLDTLGVRYERLDLMKPVFLRLDRKLDPEQLFPWREFPAR